MNKKRQYEQFFTTNYNYITDGMIINKNIVNIIEPFCGNKDMLNILGNMDNYNVLCYDIDPKADDVKKLDTLLNPPNYRFKYVITNPPYLARNKSPNKEIYDMYGQNDLYKCFIECLISSDIIGGIIIIPLNFWSSIRKNDKLLRKKFILKFQVERVNMFEERVFDDTSYAVCCIQFSNKIQKNNTFQMYVYPSKEVIDINLNKNNDYTIGGKIYRLKQDKNIKIERLTKNNIDSENITNIKLYALDSNSRNKIRLEIVEDKDIFVDNTKNLSERSFASFIITPKLDIEKQTQVVVKFNEYLEHMRKKYHSLFLSNYRESSDIARKRISFSLVYVIMNRVITVIQF